MRLDVLHLSVLDMLSTATTAEGVIIGGNGYKALHLKVDGVEMSFKIRNGCERMAISCKEHPDSYQWDSFLANFTGVRIVKGGVI